MFLDDRYALSLSVDLVAALRVGQNLDEAQFQGLLDRDEQARAVEAALHFLAARPRSVREVRDRLARRQFGEPAVEAALHRLRELSLLDDRVFTDFWTTQRRGRSPRGERLIVQELRSKGVDDELVQAAVRGSEDEAELAYRAGLTRLRALRGLDEQEFRRRLGAFLQRRGFDWDAARTALRRLLEERDGPPIADTPDE